MENKDKLTKNNGFLKKTPKKEDSSTHKNNTLGSNIGNHLSLL